MIASIKRNLKFHSTATILIIICYINSILFISAGTSYLNGCSEKMSILEHTVIISLLIFVIAIVNIMAMTLFWISDRRKEIAVRKVLGFTDSDIIGLILKEMLSIGMIAMVIAIALQYILNIAINNIFKLGLYIEFNNLILAVFVVLASVLITSIVPIKVILKVKLTEILNL